MESLRSRNLADLLIEFNDAHNQEGLVDVEAGGEVRYGTARLSDALG